MDSALARSDAARPECNRQVALALEEPHRAVRLLGAVSDGGAAAAAGREGAARVPGVALVDLGR